MLQEKLLKHFCLQRIFDAVKYTFDLFGEMLTLKAFQWAIEGFCGTSESRFTSILLQNFHLQNPQICEKNCQISFIANFEDATLKCFDQFRLTIPLWKALKYVDLELWCKRRGS